MAIALNLFNWNDFICKLCASAYSPIHAGVVDKLDLWLKTYMVILSLY
jgi:hypothetical protein